MIPLAMPADLPELYRTLAPELRRRVARRLGDDAAAADDIVQQTFLRLQEAGASIRDAERTGGWLARVAANLVVDHHRARRRGEPLPDDDSLPAPDAAPRDLRAEVAACLRPLIDALPTRYRDALVWSELDGLPQREVARRLALSLPGAKSRIQRGRALLRERLHACYRIEREGDAVVACRSRDPACRCG